MNFKFEKSPAKKGTCPSCGHKNVFRYYEGLDKKYGRCDRENTCRFFAKPGRDEAKLSIFEKEETAVVIPFPPDEAQSILSDQSSNFHKFVKNELKISEAHIRRCGVGSKTCHNVAQTVFLLQDNVSVKNAKFFSYDANCNREKKVLHASSNARNQEYAKCLFGAHLLDELKITCLVESEKTAVIASFFHPAYNWLATGGNNGMTSQKAQILKGHKVVYLPDNDKAGQASTVSRILSRNDIPFKVLSLFDDQSEGFDLADAIIERIPYKLNLEELNFESELPLSHLFEDKNGRPKLVRGELVKYFEKEGFCQIELNSAVRFARVIDNRIKIYTDLDLRQHFLSRLRQHPEYYNSILQNVNQDLSISVLNSIWRRDLKFHNDTSESTFLYFENAVVQISAKAFTALNYEDLQGLVWDHLILDRQWKNRETSKLPDCEFSQFVANVASNDQGRVRALETCIGYLTNRDRSKMKAVIFTDATLSNYPEGRTGKSLMAQGIIELRNGVMLDGKVFNTSNRFRYQMVSELTDVVIINDVGDKGQFKFEQMFTAITEGIYAEKKHQRPVFIQPKFLVTSNRAIDVFGASAKDRCVEFEFSNHYGSENSPLDEFGHKFFQDWTSTEWEGFDNYVAYCVQQYHIHGLLNPKSIHLEERRIIDHTTGNSSFLEWADKRPVNTRMEKNSMFQDYCASVPLEDALSIRQFSKYLKLYAETRDFKYEEEKSNSKVFFKFSK